MEAVVVRLMVDAKGRSGKARAFLNQIEPLVGRAYSDRSVSAWLRGSAMPPADVLLAAAKVTGISVDGYLFGESLSARQDRLEAEAKERDATIRELRAAIQARPPAG